MREIIKKCLDKIEAVWKMLWSSKRKQVEERSKVSEYFLIKCLNSLS